MRNRKSGRYYGRWTISGKQKWVKLDTDVFTVAKMRLTDEAAKITRSRSLVAGLESGSATMGELMKVLLARIEENSELRPATKVSWRTVVRKIEKTWPDLAPYAGSEVKAGAVQAEAKERLGVGLRSVRDRLADAVIQNYLRTPRKGVYRLGSKPGAFSLEVDWINAQ